MAELPSSYLGTIARVARIQLHRGIGSGGARDAQGLEERLPKQTVDAHAFRLWQGAGLDLRRQAALHGDGRAISSHDQ